MGSIEHLPGITVGAFSPGVVAGNLLFVSGVVAFHPETGEIVGKNIQEQTRQTLENLQDVLAMKCMTLADVVQCRVYLKNVERDFTAFDSVFRESFIEPYPSRTTVGVELARSGLLVEIDAVAAMP